MIMKVLLFIVPDKVRMEMLDEVKKFLESQDQE